MPDPTPLSPLAGIEQLQQAARTLSRGVKTRNVGTCEECGGNTSSGMDPLCYRCAVRAVEKAADYLAGLGKKAEEWVAARRTVAHVWVHGTQGDKAAARKRLYAAEIALYTYLTSPRETAGKEKE